MRIATYRAAQGPTWGVVDGDRVSDARTIDGAPATVLELLTADDPASWLRRLARSDAGRHDLRAVTLLAPIPLPPHDLIALGLNYVEHVPETAAATRQSTPPARPILFGKAGSSVIGPDAEIRFDRAVTKEVDWEVELAVVIGRRGRDLTAGEALDHVFGYTIANDVSARDLQFLEGRQWYRGKSLDTFCPLGPWIVTRDDLGDARGLRISLRVNGETKQSASTDQLLFGVPAIIASASSGRTLYPGDVILTGTPSGVGFTRTPPQFLRDGDVVEAEVERVGVLRNSVRETSSAQN